MASGASSGCRNSTTSTDSGRGSSEGGAGAGPRPPAVAASTRGYPHRLSNVSSSVSSVCSSSLSSRQSHHSSSSSIQDRCGCDEYRHYPNTSCEKLPCVRRKFTTALIKTQQ